MDLSLCNYTLTFHVHGYHISCLSKLIKKKKKKFLAFSKTFLQVHFGVNSGATRFAIEHQAVNEATFRCPDEMGWKPQVRIPSPKKWELKTLSSTYQFLFMQLSVSCFIICRKSPLFLQMVEFHEHERQNDYDDSFICFLIYIQNCCPGPYI